LFVWLFVPSVQLLLGSSLCYLITWWRRRYRANLLVDWLGVLGSSMGLV